MKVKKYVYAKENGMTRQEIEQKVIELAADQAGVAAAQVTRASHFVNELNYGSLGMVEFSMSAEDEFEMSPGFDARVVEETKKRMKICIPGAFTPTEILRAWNAGADVVKVFPATALGPGYFKDVLGPLPQVKLTPTGGVDVKNAGEW